MVDLLVKNGFDVIICRIDPGFLSIRIGGRMLSEFIQNVVEKDKKAIGSKHENIVLGFSMGGHYWRQMLMYDEHEHLNEPKKDKHHHTRMWIPVDSPLHGANNPLAHQFAVKSVAEKPAGFPVFNITYMNMLAAGSQEQQRYDVNGVNGFDGATHRFHKYRTNYINELENTFYLGEELTKYKGFPSATRNVAISVGSNTENYYSISPNIVPWRTYEQSSGFPFFLYIKSWDVELKRAHYQVQSPYLVFRRKIVKHGWFSTNVLVNDSYSMSHWYQLDNGAGSYLNEIKTNANRALDWNSLLGFGATKYKNDIVFVPTVSSLAIKQSEWPTNMLYDLKANKLMFTRLSDDITDPSNTDASNYFGYPHLGRPTDYKELTPMDAIFCDEFTYQHITLIKDREKNDNQSELITFLLNEIQPWYLDLQNQRLGQYARQDYTYLARYEAKHVIRTGDAITPRTPFGEFVVMPNVDLELQAGDTVILASGTHLTSGSTVHIYIEELCYGQGAKSRTHNTVDSFGDAEQFTSTYSSPVVKENNPFTVFPNPNNGTFTVSLERSIKVELSLYDLRGQCIGVWNVENGIEIHITDKGIHNAILIGVLKTHQNEIYRTKISVL